MTRKNVRGDHTPSLTSTVIEAMEAMVQDFDYVDLASSLVSSAIDLLEADAVGVMISDTAQLLHVVAASDEDMRTLEIFEIQSDEGPCLDCWYSGRLITSSDLVVDDRWTSFRHRVVDLGFRSALAAPLRLRDHNIGALNVLWRRADAIGEREIQAAQALADLAALGLTSRAVPSEATFLAEQIQKTINARVTIEQAKGMLAEQGVMDMNAAYSLLRDYSRASAAHLLDSAERVLRREITAQEMRAILTR
jgi:GAF domain-containing protein